MSRTMGSHQRTIGESQVWLTPRFVLDALGPFDLDPCAAPEPRPWDTARLHITEPRNGLLHNWEGRVWLNPPYDRRVVDKWLARLAEHGIGTALIFARTETESFFTNIWHKAEAALFLRSRLTFHRPDGSLAIGKDGRPQNAGAPSVLVAYGQEDAERLYHSGLNGHYVPIAPTVGLFVFMKAAERVVESWREVVTAAVRELGGTATLSDLYRSIDGHPKTKSNPNWQAKIRQIARAECRRVGEATYAMGTA